MTAARFVTLILLVVLAGCSSQSIEDTGATLAAPALGEVVVVLGDETGIPACVRRAMQESNPDIGLIASKDFRNALFPWFELATAPRTVADLTSLLNKPKVQKRIESLRIRYVIVVSGGTNETKTEGGIIGTGGGYLGFASWKKISRLSAIVWNFGRAEKAETIRAKVSGTAAVPAFILPLPFIPATETAACNMLGERLAESLGGDRPPEE